MSAAGEFRDELIATAKAIGAPGKGILAADESTGTIGKRFKAIDLENTEENRRNYRNLLFSAEGKYENHISGVILFEETLYQSTPEGKPFVELLQERGVIPGIKVDKGVAELPGTDGETRTQGLDGLAARCQEYYKQGARFAKWRAVLKIGNGCPSDLSIHENAHGLAAYAAICQANGLAPIVEPEILTDGEHTLEECAEATQRVQAVVTAALHQHNVLFEGMMLKPNMVLPGAQCSTEYTPEQIAQATVGTLRKTLPAAVPCVCFLSGGQGEEEATVNLNAINSLPASERPWSLTFSYGRALQASVIKTWEGKEENIAKAQEVFVARATANGLANLGQYTGDAATDLANASLYEQNYKY